MAKKDVSAIVSATGFLAAVWTEIVNAVHMRGGTDDDIHRLCRPEGREMIGKIADLIVGTCAEVFRVAVDYGQSLADMIAAGHYDWVNNDITQNHFPITGEGRVESEQVLVYLNRSASTDDVLKELESRGLRPATIAELLAFGAQYPDKQREFPIIAIGSVWQHPGGYRDVACLYGCVSERGLSLRWYEGDWGDVRYRFLASRK